MKKKPLDGKIVLVAGATRGAGRGIACMLGAAGAVVYCTGRSSRGGAPRVRVAGDSPFDLSKRPETIEETAELVTKHGGTGIAARVDSTIPTEVEALFRRVRVDHGRLDVLVNDVWGGDELTEWGKSFWELSLEKGERMLHRAVFSHIVTGQWAAMMMGEQKSGLIVEVTDGAGPAYRGNLFYDLAKSSVIRLAFEMAEELRPHGVTALAVTPGFLRSEMVLEHLGVAEENWQEGAKRDPHFIASETPFYVGRAVAALAADPDVARRAGGVFTSWDLAREYKFTDVDGRRPDWGEYFAKYIAKK